MSIEDIRAAYKILLNTEDGKIVMDDLKARYHINGSTFSIDPNETAYREGQRTVVLFLLSMLQETKTREDIVET